MEFEPILSFTCDRVGRNVAAGMTGGLAYILDEDNTLLPKVCAFSLQYFIENIIQLETCQISLFFSPAANCSVSPYFIIYVLSQLFSIVP